jgi:hypothetical protein
MAMDERGPFWSISGRTLFNIVYPVILQNKLFKVFPEELALKFSTMLLKIL